MFAEPTATVARNRLFTMLEFTDLSSVDHRAHLPAWDHLDGELLLRRQGEALQANSNLPQKGSFL